MQANQEQQSSRILVVDDDEDIRELITAQLVRDGQDVVSVSCVADIRPALAERPIDLIVLDLNLPDGDGLNLCRELRAEGVTSGIIMVTARDSAVDRVLGLELGADDYLTKPFEPRELVARVRNLLRRTRSGDSVKSRNARVATFGGWRLDLLQRRLVAPDDRLVILSSAEFRLLSRFTEAPNTVLTREELLPERAATVVFDRSIDLQISRLRQKLAGVAGGEALILTVRNEGYVLASDVTYS
ncbi:response regulator [Sphingomonas oligophenolica]|uniref:Response regulator transcription factor n=1 Tax=Sphingomonas oligophenolica TaxID=301154 RepID=A0ABU9YC79_9SPHN